MAPLAPPAAAARLRQRELGLVRVDHAREVVLRVVKHHVDGALEAARRVNCGAGAARLRARRVWPTAPPAAPAADG